MTDEKAQYMDKFVVRLPAGMRDSLKFLATSNRRSMNAEVINALEEWLKYKTTFSLTELDESNYAILGMQISKLHETYNKLVNSNGSS